MHHLVSLSLLLLPALAHAAEPPSVMSSLGQMVFGLVVVIALLLGTLWMIKRLARPRGPGDALKVIGGVALGSRERIMLVEVAGKVLVVGVTTANIRTLHVLDASDLANAQPESDAGDAAPTAARPDFQKWLQQSLKRRDDNAQG